MKTTTHADYPVHLTPGGPALSLDLLDTLPAALRGDPDALMTFHGCRFGENALAVARAFAGRVIATDEDTEAVFYAKMELEKIGAQPNLNFRVLSPLATAMHDESCDTVFLEGILSEHPVGRTLAETARILKPGAFLCISDSVWLKRPVPGNIAEIWETLNRKVYTREELHTMLEGRGFAVERSEDRSTVLEPYYEQFYREVREKVRNKFMGEKHMKGLIRHYKHEIDTYLKFGGSDFMGYGMVVAAKK